MGNNATIAKRSAKCLSGAFSGGFCISHLEIARRAGSGSKLILSSSHGQARQSSKFQASTSKEASNINLPKAATRGSLLEF
jgi:hypothetical protein